MVATCPSMEVRFTDFDRAETNLEGEFWEYASNGEFIFGDPKIRPVSKLQQPSFSAS